MAGFWDNNQSKSVEWQNNYNARNDKGNLRTVRSRSTFWGDEEERFDKATAEKQERINDPEEQAKKRKQLADTTAKYLDEEKKRLTQASGVS